MGGKIIPRIRLTSAKDLVEVEAELGNRETLNECDNLASNHKQIKNENKDLRFKNTKLEKSVNFKKVSNPSKKALINNNIFPATKAEDVIEENSVTASSSTPVTTCSETASCTPPTSTTGREKLERKNSSPGATTRNVSPSILFTPGPGQSLENIQEVTASQSRSNLCQPVLYSL